MRDPELDAAQARVSRVVLRAANHLQEQIDRARKAYVWEERRPGWFSPDALIVLVGPDFYNDPKHVELWSVEIDRLVHAGLLEVKLSENFEGKNVGCYAITPTGERRVAADRAQQAVGTKGVALE